MPWYVVFRVNKSHEITKYIENKMKIAVDRTIILRCHAVLASCPFHRADKFTYLVFTVTCGFFLRQMSLNA